MTEMIKFPSIEQFRNVIRHIRISAAYVGQDKDDNAIYDYTRPVPTLKYHGTVKLHGTNAGVCQHNDERWYQSRERILTPMSDNAGFAFWAETNKEKFDSLFSKFQDTDIVSVFGEWCGQGIQRGVGISELPKMFVVFALKVNDNWAPPPLMVELLNGTNLICIESFPTYSVTIDFDRPELTQNEMIAITEQVEACCPVAKSFGVDGIGEGVVWICDDENWANRDSGMWFKIKGEKHSSSKVKTLAAIDMEKVGTIQECVEKICTENRMQQGLSVMKENGLDIDIKNMGSFLKWLASDCIKEELDTIVASGLEPKSIGKTISTKGRLWFMDILNKA